MRGPAPPGSKLPARSRGLGVGVAAERPAAEVAGRLSSLLGHDAVGDGVFDADGILHETPDAGQVVDEAPLAGCYVAGPLLGMLLADQGAEVIEIERPGGDPGREQPAFGR